MSGDIDALIAKLTERATCTLCAKVESQGFYTGCMIRDGYCTDSGWSCDGDGHLARLQEPKA